MLARARLVDTLMERAIEGQEEVIVRDPDSHTRTRHRHDNRLAMSLLARLDRFADPSANGDAAPHADARIVASDWDAFLQLVGDAGESGADARAAYLADVQNPPPGPCQLCADAEDGQDDRVDETDDATGDGADSADQAKTFDLSSHFEVWWSGEHDAFRTNFPSPPGFVGEESGSFGDRGYHRALSDDETRIETLAVATQIAEDRALAETYRCVWFGLSDGDCNDDARSQDDAHASLADAVNLGWSRMTLLGTTSART